MQVTYNMAIRMVPHANFGRWGVHVAIDSVVGDALRLLELIHNYSKVI